MAKHEKFSLSDCGCCGSAEKDLDFKMGTIFWLSENKSTTLSLLHLIQEINLV